MLVQKCKQDSYFVEKRMNWPHLNRLLVHGRTSRIDICRRRFNSISAVQPMCQRQEVERTLDDKRQLIKSRGLASALHPCEYCLFSLRRCHRCCYCYCYYCISSTSSPSSSSSSSDNDHSQPSIAVRTEKQSATA
jgi:hypothetical protein